MGQMYNEVVHDKANGACFPLFVSIAANAANCLSPIIILRPEQAFLLIC
jgi:hypothetical protein